MNILWSVFCCCSFSPIFPTFLCSRIVNARTLMVNHQPNGASTFIVVVGSVKTNCSTGGLCNYDRIAREEATKTCTHIKRTEKYVCVCVSASMKLLHAAHINRLCCLFPFISGNLLLWLVSSLLFIFVTCSLLRIVDFRKIKTIPHHIHTHQTAGEFHIFRERQSFLSTTLLCILCL